jgi:hypothetical protein
VRTLEPGESLTLNYAVVIADGASDFARMSTLADAGVAVLKDAGVDVAAQAVSA